MSVITLNRVQYSGLDFATHEDEILARLQVNFASTYNDFAVAALGIMLVDIYAFGMSALSFYLDRRATDLFLTTGRTQKSVARAARQLGYKMAPATASSVDIETSPTIAQIFAIPLPIGFQLKSPDGSFWEAGGSHTWPASNTDTITITFSQTQTLQAVFTSNGTPNQVFSVSNIPTDEFMIGPGTDGISQVTVTVNGVNWTENELLTFGKTNQFEIGYHDDPPTLRFGDNVAGNIPATNAQIRLTFKSSRGTAGQVTSGQPMTAVTPLSVNFTTINFNLNIPTGSEGGTDPETIDKAKANAPSFFASRGVNITKKDYNVRAGSFVDSVFGGVAAASAVLVRDASSDALLQTLINSISSTSEDYVTTVDASVASANASMAAATTAITAAVANSTAITIDVSSLNTSTATANTSSNTAVIASGLVDTLLGQISTNASSLSASVGGILIAGSDQLTTGTQSSLLTLIAGVQAAATQGTTQSATVTTSATAVSNAISTMKNALADITVQQASFSTNTNTAKTNITTTTTTLATLVSSVAAIDNQVADLGQQIIDHVGSFLSSDCQANLIEVPILTFDSDGFYAAPTIALIQSLQTYLDANRAITQVVKVISGAELLVGANITAHVGVLTGYVESIIRSQIQALILTVLKKRPFAKSLKLSELYWKMAPNGVSVVPGVDFVDVLITGPLPKIDGNGNLVINENEVVTRGSITVTSEVVNP